jgi:hypothetical protein
MPRWAVTLALGIEFGRGESAQVARTGSAFPNQQVLAEVRDFAGWKRELRSRGTPHRI